jgi:hypothetical protein
MPDYNEDVGGAVAIPLPSAKIIQDEEGQSPREWSDLGVMACWHRRYILGDIQPKVDPTEWLKENAPEGSIVLALSLYDHSGITMRVGPPTDRWDSGYVGYIVATPEKIRENFGVKRITAKVRKQAEECLKGEVESYDEYLQGNIWGYVLEGGTADGDSCWGFLGSDPSTLAAMKGHVSAEYHDALTAAWEHRFN